MNNKTYGVRITKANKKQRNIKGSIGTSIYWSELAEEGGTKRPFKSRKIAIPVNAPKSYRKAGGARKFIQDKKAFAIPIKGGNKGIFTRKGKAKKLDLAFVLKDSAVINKHLGFKKWANRLILRAFARNHRIAMQKALKTAR